MEPAAGFVLCGGSSRRMGTDKALLPFRGRPLVEHVALLVEEATQGPATLIGPVDRFANRGFDVVSEPNPGSGPLAAIVTALGLEHGERNLIVACDMPGLEVEFLRSLLEASGPDCDVVIPSVDGQMSPLCAVWRHSARPVLEQAVRRRQLKVHDAIKSLKIKTLDAGAALLANTNTPEEWLLWSA